MTKKEFLVAMADKVDATQMQVDEMISAAFELIAEGLAREEDFTWPEFGKFLVKDRAARKGRNPSTGAEIDIPAAKVVQFKPSSKLKEKVNQG